LNNPSAPATAGGWTATSRPFGNGKGITVQRQTLTPSPARPKVLYLVHRVPYPPDKGDRIRNYHILAWLARRASVHLACLADEVGDDEVGILERFAERVAIVRLGRGSRWLRVASSLALGRTASEGAFQSRAMCRLLRLWARTTQYDVILASASSLAPYLRLEEFRGVPAVVDFMDVDSQKWLDYAKSSRAPRAWLYATEGRRLGQLEREVTAWARAVIVISQAEANLFRHTCDATNVHIVTNGVDMATFQPIAEAAGSERTCLFVGALDYRPNIEGVRWFVREVWPEIHGHRPGARLRLVGRRPVPSVRRLGTVPGVEVVGQVPDVRPYLESAGVVVVPLRLARGVQNKVLEALAMSKATVASPQSLAGLTGHSAVPTLVASTPTEWIDSVIRLMDDRDERRRLGEDGRRYVEEFHRWDRALGPLESILGLPAHRDRYTAIPAAADGLA
jgi:sugar transferase (PEP-CTERM/EpsH1 system associated)